MRYRGFLQCQIKLSKKLSVLRLCLLTLVGTIIFHSHSSLAQVMLGNHKELAVQQNQEAETTQILADNLNPEMEGISLDLLGKLEVSRGNYPKAIELFQQSLTIERGNQSYLGEVNSLNNLGTAFFLNDNLTKAEQTLREAIAIEESFRYRLGLKESDRVSFFETQSLTYRTLQQILVAQKKFPEALEIAERGRARIFVEQLSQVLSSKGSEENNNLPQINPPRIEDLQRIAKTQQATLIEYSLVPNPAEIFVYRQQDELQNQPQKLFIWVVQPSGKIEFRELDLTQELKEGRSISELVRLSRLQMGIGGRGSSFEYEPIDLDESGDLLKKIYQLLIAPIARFLPQDPKARVIFVPQESLFLVSFAALKDENNQYLLSNHTILTAPAIQVLDFTQKLQSRSQQESLQDFLVVGNPTMPKVIGKSGGLLTQLPELKGAEAEAIAIAKLLNTQAVTGDDATKAIVLERMQRSQIIHLATHGLLDDIRQTGIPGVIALAPTPEDDGLLTADEILQLKLKAELAVLSACDTGRGSIRSDGVIGLSRAFIRAGIPSIIVSLWSIPDASTAFLMREFYHFRNQGLDKAQALRQAMLQTKNQYPHPRNWAAFTLIGEIE